MHTNKQKRAPDTTIKSKNQKQNKTKEPPQIRENQTTTNVEPVKEFNSIELRCVGKFKLYKTQLSIKTCNWQALLTNN